jgi:hypothetical protein
MRLPVDIKKCVVFIGLQMANKEMRIVGTGFLIFDDISQKSKAFIVTAKHVINGIYGKGLDEVFIRVNLTTGNSKWHKTEYKNWKLNSDNDVDVALHQVEEDKNWNHVFYQLSTSLTDDSIAQYEIDVGDEVFIIGLFKHHHGKIKNIPIARIGNVSAMREEKIQTSQHLMDGYLIEARSIGGLSGSPVFINLGEVRFLNGTLQHTVDGKAFYLMGLIYGHYDVKTSGIDDVNFDQLNLNNVDRVNTGIAIVTPVDKIIATIKEYNYSQHGN